ncbi:MAG: family peptidase [Pseudonocardiales bacterium]|nr:family peptidase [Pseudonocardiales bacterium]
MTASPVPEVEVRRSARRRRTVSAYREKDVVVVLIPARFSRAEEARWVDRMVAGVLAREERSRQRGPKGSDSSLMRRASELNRRYFGGDAQPDTIRWVDNMEHRWGSCTPVNRTIRISSRLKQVPEWVLDYVLVHELAHLLVAPHDGAFWALVNRYERTERARGYLEGYAVASRLEMNEDDTDAVDGDMGADPDADGADADVDMEADADADAATDADVDPDTNGPGPGYGASGVSSSESEVASVGPVDSGVLF